MHKEGKPLTISEEQEVLSISYDQCQDAGEFLDEMERKGKEMDTATKKTGKQQDSTRFLELHKQLFRANRAELKAREKTSKIWQSMVGLLEKTKGSLIVTVRFDMVRESRICLDSSLRIHDIPGRYGFCDWTEEQLKKFFKLGRAIWLKKNGIQVCRLKVTGIIDDVGTHYISDRQVSNLHLRLKTCNPDDFVILGIPYDSIVSIGIAE